MRLGIFAKTFPRDSVAATFAAVRAAGLERVQFNLSLTSLGSSLPKAIPEPVAAETATAAADHGIVIDAVSGTYNTAHPDPRARADGRARLDVVIAAAAGLGTRVVTLCTGTRDPQDMWRAHPDNASRQAWRDMVDSVAHAVASAEAARVVLAFEPEHNNVVHDARSGRRLLDEIASPHLKVVLDPANLFPGGDLARQQHTLEEAFGLLGTDLVLAHAKDVREDGEIVAAGRGALDYARYLELLRATGDVPLHMHGLSEAEVPESVAAIREAANGVAT